MTMYRTIPASFRREMEKQESAEFPLVFLSFSHPSLIDGINVVSDPENFILDGVEFQGFEFAITLLTDSEGPPKAQLSVQNIDRIIGKSVRESIDPIQLEFQVIAVSQFDLAEFPRVALDDPVERILWVRFGELREVEGNALFINGTVVTKDYTQEPYPGMRATEERCPGLFW